MGSRVLLAVIGMLAVGSVMGYPAGRRVCPAFAGRSGMDYTNRADLEDVVYRGHYAYGADQHGLGVWDVSDPSNPIHVAHWDAPSQAFGVALGPGSLVLLADGGSGLIVLDLTVPSHPVKVGSFDGPGEAQDVAISGNTAYVAANDSGLQLIDVSNPANPTLLGNYDTPGGALGVAISGDVAFVADDDAGLQLIDVSNPAKPTLLGNYDTTGNAEDVTISGRVAYVADGGWGLQLVDVSDPANPTSLKNHRTPGWAIGIALSGGMAYVADAFNGLQLIDVSDPANPVSLGSYNTPGWAVGIAISGKMAYVADSRHGLQLIDVSDPANPTPLGSFDTPGITRGPAISAHVAYVPDGRSGLQIIDVSEPSSPALLGTYETRSYVEDVAISGKVAYVAEGRQGLHIIDLSDPSRPFLLGGCKTQEYACGIAISGNTAYVADGFNGLQLIDVTEPLYSTLLGNNDAAGDARDVAISGNVAYVADYYAGLQVVDVSDPMIPASLGRYDAGMATYAVTVSGDVAYLANGGYGLLIFDVSDPSRPSGLARYETPGEARAVTVSGDVAYVADSSYGLQLIDVSNPSRPSLLGSYDTPGFAYGVAASGGVAYVADGYDLEIITTQCRAPAAAFSWQQINGDVEFRDHTLYGATSQAWDFGDGSTSAQQSPSHRYAAPGKYTVTLTVNNDEGHDSVSQEVIIQPGTPEISDPGRYVYLIPGSAHTPGLEGTSWISDVVLWNGGTGDARVNLYFLAGGRDNSRLTGIVARVVAGTSLKLSDVVGTTFGQTRASGAILVGSDRPLAVTSRTYNDTASGSYGQFIAGVPVGQAVGPGETARLIQLTRDDHYRTNLGFTNASATPIAVRVELYDHEGSHLDTWSRTIEPYGFYQETDIFKTDVTDGYALVSSPTAGAVFFPYASVIDKGSGDPVFVTAQAVTGQAGEVLYVAGSAHVDGARGTHWRTDLEVFNPGWTQASFTVELLASDRENTTPDSRSFNLAAGRSVRYSDVLQTIFGFTGAAALRITPSNGTITVTSRTYNEAPKGSYGQFIPAVRGEDAITEGESVPLVQLSQSAFTNTGYRTNIGLVNTSDRAITVAIDLYNGNGGKLGTKTVNLNPYEYTQKDKIFTEFTGFTLDDCYVVLSTSTSGGSFLAYGSVVDNRSGDPVYVRAQ